MRLSGGSVCTRKKAALGVTVHNLGAVFAPNYARDYARGGGDYAEPQYGSSVFGGLLGKCGPLAGLETARISFAGSRTG
jgi:hypothetical protein